jgi:hypothetical protein
MDSRRMELFSSFFSAIQSFVREMITTGSKSLKNIEMGNFLVNITNLPKMELDIVAIADKDDGKPLSKVTPKLIKLLKSHSNIFEDWNGDRSRFKILDLEIIQIIQTNKKLLGDKSLTDGQKEIIGSILDNLPELEKNQQEKYRNERKLLEDQLKNTPNIMKKVELNDAIFLISQKLKDHEDVNRCQMMRKKYFSEIQSTKEKMAYFLKRTKEAISKTVEGGGGGSSLMNMDFKDAYLNFYSFSSKLKMFGNNEVAEEYIAIARFLLEKPEEQGGELSKYISQVLSLNDDIDSYIPK